MITVMFQVHGLRNYNVQIQQVLEQIVVSVVELCHFAVPNLIFYGNAFSNRPELVVFFNVIHSVHARF